MKFRRFLYIILASIIAFSVFDASYADAARKKSSKARTSQTSSKNKNRSSKNSSRKKSSSGSRSSKKKRKSGKSSTRRNVKRTAPVEPVETPQNDSLTLTVNSALLSWIPSDLNPGGLRVNSVKPDSRSRCAKISLNENFTYLPVTRQLIDSLGKVAKAALPDSLAGYSVNLTVKNKGLAYYITKVDPLPERFRKNPPFVSEVNPLVNPKKGMENDVVAMWHSHGRYFRPGSGAWMWQRPLLFQVVEDTYTMGYILPFAVPMLENAGAYVMLPRERDTNIHEVIVDNDTNDEGKIYSQPYYKEMTGSKPWATGELEGFIYDLPDFRDTENPFENGTYRQTTTVKSGKPSVAAWYADIPEDGEYAVYVSYKTLPNSTEDAHYTVNYSGGSKEFTVNQTMGGGTWIYLGTFPLEKGYSDTEAVVTLTNITDKEGGTIVTADAVKIGGGMGNIARSNRRADIYYDPSTPENNLTAANSISNDDEEGDNDDDDDDENGDDETGDDETNDNVDKELPAEKETQNSSSNSTTKGVAPSFRTSGMPRFLEGARYWLHWAGFPESIYSPYHGADDYKDDYTARGHWVNYLAGGSRVLPNREGLNIPVDVAMALHSDAGKRNDDSFVGTLGIYFTQNGDSYRDGTPRINSRMLTDLIMRQITGDIRQKYEPRWTRRSMWDKSYVEARVPEVPTTLIELMSHQNFADMQYGLDPNFRFDVARAIYKGIARFMAERKGRELVIQPLPVKDFAIHKLKKNHYRLTWEPTPDPLEKTAMPTKYIVMERNEGDLGFHKIAETSHPRFDIKVTDDDIHSFKIIAVNEGGASFPSEVLALRESPDNSKPVLIINGFTRISGPEHFKADNRAGFNADTDFGVPYIKDISFTGYQTEFNRNAGESFGRSGSNYATTVIAGNTFDYPYIHGVALADAGKGFVSCSAAAVENGNVKLDDFKTIDLILGKQKATIIGNGKSGLRYIAFPEALQKELRHFTEKGGNLIVSGQYVASDPTDYRVPEGSAAFAESVIGVIPGEGARTRSGSLTDRSGRTLRYSSTLNDKIYIVENPGILAPAPGANAEEIFTFSDTHAPAGYIINRGNGKNVVLSVPIEAFSDESQRSQIVADILRILENN